MVLTVFNISGRGELGGVKDFWTASLCRAIELVKLLGLI